MRVEQGPEMHICLSATTQEEDVELAHIKAIFSDDHEIDIDWDVDVTSLKEGIVSGLLWHVVGRGEPVSVDKLREADLIEVFAKNKKTGDWDASFHVDFLMFSERFLKEYSIPIERICTPFTVESKRSALRKLQSI